LCDYVKINICIKELFFYKEPHLHVCKIDRNYTLKYWFEKKEYILMFPNNAFSMCVAWIFSGINLSNFTCQVSICFCISEQFHNNLKQYHRDWLSGWWAIYRSPFGRRSSNGIPIFSEVVRCPSGDSLFKILWSREIIIYDESCFYFLLTKIRKVFNQLLRNLNRFLFYLAIWQQ